MSATVIELPIRRREPEITLIPDTPESCDVYELAAEAAEHVEAYRRAPWTQLNDPRRMLHLDQALLRLQRVKNLELGKVPMKTWGD